VKECRSWHVDRIDLNTAPSPSCKDYLQRRFEAEGAVTALDRHTQLPVRICTVPAEAAANVEDEAVIRTA